MSGVEVKLRSRKIYFGLEYITDNKRHLVCLPYSTANLHRMAGELKIGKHFFHKDHYDVPLLRKAEIESRCTILSPKDVVRIIKGELKSLDNAEDQ